MLRIVAKLSPTRKDTLQNVDCGPKFSLCKKISEHHCFLQWHALAKLANMSVHSLISAIELKLARDR